MSKVPSIVPPAFREKLVESTRVVTIQAAQAAKSTIETVKDINYKKHASNATLYAKDHPYWTAGMAVSLVPIVAPAAVGGGALGLAGFSASGPVSGTLAASVQAATNPVVRGGIFATCQSAAMGGYGAATVFGAIQWTAVAANLAAYARFLPWGKKEASGDETTGNGQDPAPDMEADLKSKAASELRSAQIDEEYHDDNETVAKAEDQPPNFVETAR